MVSQTFSVFSVLVCVRACVYNTGFIAVYPNICLGCIGWSAAGRRVHGEREGVCRESVPLKGDHSEFWPNYQQCLHLHIWTPPQCAEGRVGRGRI